MPPRFLFFLAGPGVALMAIGCSPTVTLTSSPRTSPVAIDGSERDFIGDLRQALEGAPA